MKIVIAGAFSPDSKAHIRESFPEEWTVQIVCPGETEGALADAEVLIPEHVSVDAALLEKAPKLRLIQTGAGYDNIDIEACTRRGIQVCNAPGVNADAVAEHMMAFLLCWYKNILYLDRFQKSRGKPEELFYTGAELSDLTLGILGMGNVGRRAAAYGRAFHMRVLGYSRSGFEMDGVERVDLERLFRESDALSVHVPLTEETWHMVGAEQFSRMKPDALLINTSRGAVLNEAELADALKDRRIGGACLDVYEDEPLREDSPLRTLDNVILTPHTAGFPDGVRFHKKRYAYFVSNIRRLIRNEPPEGRLNTI